MKRSLHIGINNYPGTQNDLNGCVNDARDWQEALTARGFQTTLMLDAEATRSNMAAAIAALVADTGREDIAVITYSGHGTWVPDEDGDEPDGRDEALCPYDVADAQLLVDDDLYDIFSRRRTGARIVMISDSCHSGSVARLWDRLPSAAPDPWKFQKARYLAPEIVLANDPERLRRARKVECARARGKIRWASLLLAACKDNEYSYDAWFEGRPNGAFTHIALQALSSLPPGAVYADWYLEIRKYLPHVNYPQTPQLSGSTQQRRHWRVLEP